MVERLGMSNQIAAARFGALVASIFAIIATGLAALGVYSVVVQSTVDRQREIAVRVALGANARHVVRILIRDGNVFVLGGLLLGLILTVAVAKWLGVDEVFESKGLLLGAIIGCLFAAMAVAGLLPAYRETRLAPMEVLRAD
jgi:ABC-type lipoprotein release transport system permease subunit